MTVQKKRKSQPPLPLLRGEDRVKTSNTEKYVTQMECLSDPKLFESEK
jgi:hypothetical protein